MKINKLNLILSNEYKIIKKIGSGGFGEIYVGKSTISGEQVAIKLV